MRIRIAVSTTVSMSTPVGIATSVTALVQQRAGSHSPSSDPTLP